MREYAFCGNLKDAATTDFDVVVLGSGIAGLYCALNLDPKLSVAIWRR